MRRAMVALALGVLAVGAGDWATSWAAPRKPVRPSAAVVQADRAAPVERPHLEFRAVPPEWVEIARGGNRLLVSRRAAVAFQTLSGCVSGLDRNLPASHTAFQVARAWPPDVVEYVLCVIPEGTLVVGQQVHRFDAAHQRWTFQRDVSIADGPVAYQPLDDGRPWRWLVSVPVSRQALVNLEIRADEAAWPVKTVSIDASVSD